MIVFAFSLVFEAGAPNESLLMFASGGERFWIEFWTLLDEQLREAQVIPAVFFRDRPSKRGC